MTATAHLQIDAETEIRKLLDARCSAIREKNVDQSLAHYAPDVLLFDVVDPLQYSGLNEIRRRTEEWFASFEGPIAVELRNLNVVAGDSVAFSRSLNHVSAITRDGGKLDMWWRATECFRKIDGKWMVTHEHNSVPFDTGSGKASLTLTP